MRTTNISQREIPVTIVVNKCDLNNRHPEVCQHGDLTVVHLSAKTGAGVDLLKQHLKTSMGYNEGGEGNFSARRRHLQLSGMREKFLAQWTTTIA